MLKNVKNVKMHNGGFGRMSIKPTTSTRSVCRDTAAQNKPIHKELLNINPVPNNINEIYSIGAQCNHT